LPETGRPWSPDEYRQFLAASRDGRTAGPRLGPWVNLPQTGAVTEEYINDDRIRFRTTAVGYPHLIKVSWFPNWKVKGAARVYSITPTFLLVYPERENVELFYGSLWSDWAGRALSALGVAIVLILALRARRRRDQSGTGPGPARLLKFLDATFGAGLCWLAGATRFMALRSENYLPVNAPETLQRVLVIRPGGMGDLILLVPVLRRLRAAWPRVAIDLVCEQRNAAVMSLTGLDVTLLPYDRRPLRLLAQLLRTRYDAALDTEQFHHFSALIAWLSGAPFRIGFKIAPARNLLYTHLVPYAMDGYEGHEFGRLFEPLGVPASGYLLAGALSVTDVALPGAAAAQLERATAQGSLAAIYAGASTPYKQWSTANYGALARQLVSERGMSVVLLGGARDRAACAAAAAAAGKLPDGRVIVLAGELTLAQTAQVLRHSRLCVGGDSGPAHLAQALGTPCVVLFGPSDVMKWGGRGERVRIVRRPIPCAPCFIFGYHKLCRHWHCMRAITVEDVLSACTAVRLNL
ncbi:MAG: glycosyltransferase family 9 protein, partial [Kiritimatiellia bacterium]